ncbi:MAG: glycosyltransferase family 4 protein [Sulfuricaulis sp.]
MATSAAGHEVTVVSSPEPNLEQLGKQLGVRIHPVYIPRELSPLSDLRSLVALYRYFLKERFDIVHSTTPKAGLLSAIAAFLARVPMRLHTFTGQPWIHLTGPMRWLAKLGDRVIVHLNTRCYADSRSQAAYLMTQNIAGSGKIAVLGEGSLGGVDLAQFNPESWVGRQADIRKEIGIPPNAHVITYIGRLTKDKGISELVSSFSQLLHRGMDVYLLLIGPFEPERDPLPKEVHRQIRQETRIKIIGYSTEPERYLSISTVFCLPSYREGFGNVVIEAAAMGIPAVATRIVGLVDSVVDGETGILVPSRDVRALSEALFKILSDDSTRMRLGNAAQVRARNFYNSDAVNRTLLEEYEKLRSQYRISG